MGTLRGSDADRINQSFPPFSRPQKKRRVKDSRFEEFPLDEERHLPPQLEPQVLRKWESRPALHITS
ncbi:hypothetical protein NC652_027131 [Populus alba x Populus x berolinensis]|nr:hypothetical protein NC652_027131 [Populus alba x Populus x berolinensis]